MYDSSRLTLHTVLPPEVDISSLRLTSKIAWPAEVSPIVTGSSHMMDRQAKSDRQPIPKPKGVVGRIKEGGYSLIKVLRWEREQYNEIQVGWVISLPHKYWLNLFRHMFVSKQLCTVTLGWITSPKAKMPYHEYAGEYVRNICPSSKPLISHAGSTKIRIHGLLWRTLGD